MSRIKVDSQIFSKILEAMQQSWAKEDELERHNGIQFSC